VVVGQDVAVFRDDEPRPRPLLKPRLLLKWRQITEETLEPRWDLHPRQLAGHLCPSAGLDIHHAGFDQLGYRRKRLAQILERSGGWREGPGLRDAAERARLLLRLRLIREMEESRGQKAKGKG
jgi:hypothetical protein